MLIIVNASSDLVGVFTFLILVGTLSALVPYALSSLAGFVLERRRTRDGTPASTRVLVIAVLSMVYSVWAIIGAGVSVIGWGLALFAAGLPVYVVVSRRYGQATRVRRD